MRKYWKTDNAQLEFLNLDLLNFNQAKYESSWYTQHITSVISINTLTEGAMSF